LDTGNKLNEAIAALTEMSEMNHTSNKGSVTVSPKVSGQRTTTKEPIRKGNMTLQIPGIPRLNCHRGTRGLSSTVSLNSFNSTNNNKEGTISSKNRTNNITGSPITNRNINENIIYTQREENSPQNAPIRSPITDPIINDNSVNVIDTQREENSQHAPIRRTLRTRATKKKQAHKMNTTVYRIFYDNGALHQGYICGFDTNKGYYKIKYQISKKPPKKRLIEYFENQTRQPWQVHYQRLGSIKSMSSAVKQYQECPLHLNFQMDSEKQ
jgi:hypothetical protein